MSEPPLLEFPTRYPIKIMGADDGGFVQYATGLIEAHTGPLRPEDVELRPSRNGRFLSVTVYIQAQSQVQIEAIYRDLAASERVLMAL